MGAGDTRPQVGQAARKERTTFGSIRAAAGALAGIVKNPDRPASFDLLFWSILALTYVFHVFAPEIPAPGVRACADDVGLCRPGGGVAGAALASFRDPLRKLLSPTFVLAATAMLLASELSGRSGSTR